MHISITPEIITNFFGLPITNSLIASFLTTLVFITIAYLATRKLKEVPRGLQNILEFLIESLLNMIDGVTEDRNQTYKFFPLIATIFIFVILSNWMGLIPGFGSVGFYEMVGEETSFAPLLRSANSDLNTTIALSIISVFSVQILGITTLGFAKYAKKFINFKSPISFFVGILELISEISKLVSFSFRLFGNVFAGEVLLVVMMALIPFVIPVPFFALEVFVGFIQALVFSMLTLVFLKMATVHEEA